MNFSETVTSPRFEIKYHTNHTGYNEFIFIFRRYGFIKTYPIRTVSSIYYDNHLYSSISENLAGITPRSKYRLRWYETRGQSKYGLKFEKKIKKGNLGIKKIINIDSLRKKIFKNFLIKNISELSKIKDESRLPKNFSPQLLCSYQREYYENCNGVRLTVDKEIKYISAKNRQSIYQLKNTYLSSNLTILEFKFNNKNKIFLKSLLNSLPSSSTRFSKYILGQSKLQGFSYL